MSFGANNTTKAAENNLGGVSEAAFPLSSALESGGQSLIGNGLNSINSGTNYFNTLLNGNAANTSALLQPSINQIRGGNQNALQAISSLTPRGGGRSGTLFNAAYAPSQQIQSLFNSGRTTAATALPQIGQGVLGTGAGLFSNATAPLNAATGASSSLANVGQTQQQISNNLLGGIGGLFGSLLTAPSSTGSGSILGNLLGL